MCLLTEWITERVRDRSRFTLQKSRNDVARPSPPEEKARISLVSEAAYGTTEGVSRSWR